MMKAAFLCKYGDISSIKIQEVPIPIPNKGQVLIKVEAAPIHPMDLAFIYGSHPIIKALPAVPGFEGSGTVIKSGGGAKGWYLDGKRVCFWQFDASLPGTWAEYVLCSIKYCSVIHDDLNWYQGSLMMINPLTAMMIAEKIKKGKHSCFIHNAASSSIGKMIVKYSNYNNLKCINIVRNHEGFDSLTRIAADFILVSSEPNFEAKLKYMCQDLNPTCAFDPIGGSFTGKILSLLEDGGELYMYGNMLKTDIREIPYEEIVFNGKKIGGLWVKDWFEKLSSVKRFKILKKIQENNFLYKTEVAGVFDFDNIHETIIQAENDHYKGKYIIVPKSSEKSNEGRKSSRESIVYIKTDYHYEEFQTVEVTEEQAYKYLSSEVLKLKEKIPEFVWDYEQRLSSDISDRSYVLLPDENIYIGQWMRNKPHGKGICFYKNGSLYEGYWEYKFRSGKGRLISANGDWFEGEWKGDIEDGSGTLHFHDGRIIRGTFYSQEVVGIGIEFGINGERYEGTFLNRKRDGEGKLIWEDGTKYEGNFKCGVMNEEGMLKYPDGKVFVGYFSGNRAFGLMSYPDGTKFKGEIVDFKEEGRGVLIDTEGNAKEGIWNNGAVDWLEDLFSDNASSCSTKIEKTEEDLPHF
ncbi:unnamed protein product [Blepharisma stoltei]|uniref:Alcohol dehydrogenase-like N-terminal domain-containing protein n=1 Tax=Blepharisma stoltei TaxID=1481888 RepID=A0AAU9IAW2_9CILI|nr:unnamed protein product [Blepharisma stoltei]